MKARAFDYVRPASLEAAFAAFRSTQGEGCYIAGGQSLIPALALRLQAPAILIDLADIAALQGIALAGRWLRIGASTRHAAMLSDPMVARHAPLLREAAAYVAHPAIRNRGTIGGSVALADPASEFPAMMLALDAEIEIAGIEGVRRVAAVDYFRGLFDTALAPGEVLVALHVPTLSADQRYAFDELARRRGDYAIVGAGVMAGINGDVVRQVRVALLSVADTPVRARQVEAVLCGATLDGTVIARAQEALGQDIDPPGDETMPAATRLHLARVLLGRLLGRILGRIGETA